MRPIVFVNSLGVGGLERVCVTVCNQWHREGKPFKLVCLYAGGPLERDLEGGVDLEVWNCRTRNAWFRVRRLIGASEPADPILALSRDMAGLLGLMKRMRLCPNPVVYREPSAARAVQSLWRKLLYRGLIARLDGFVAQTDATAADLGAAVGGSPDITIVPNPSRFVVGRESLPVRLPPADADATGLRCLAVGRLAQVKGYDRLLPAFAAILQRRLGAAPAHRRRRGAETEIESAIARLGLQGRVELLGQVPNVETLYQQADVLLLASYFEGLPNVVIEALAFGCPVVAAAGGGGTVEFLTRIGLADYLVYGDFVAEMPKVLERLCGSDPAGWNAARTAMVDLVHPRTVADQFWRMLERYARRSDVEALGNKAFG